MIQFQSRTLIRAGPRADPWNIQPCSAYSTVPIAGLDKHTLLISRSGRELAIEDTAAPIRSSDGENIGAIVVFRDVTQQRP